MAETTIEDVVAAYRFILGRDPENAARTPEAASSFKTLEDLRSSLLQSGEAQSALYTHIFRNTPQWLRVPTSFARQIYICLSDIAVSKNILFTGNWEPEVGAGILSLLQPNSVFLDVGANIGWFSLLVGDYLARASAGGEVIAVEANPSLLPYLMASIVDSGLAQTISVKPYAVSHDMSLVQMEGGQAGNIGGLNIQRVEDIQSSSRRNIVPTIRLDDLLSDMKRLDLVKMDIEGAEYMAIQGFKKTLKKLKPKIIMEINGDALRGVSGVSVADLIKEMKSIGYNCYDFRGKSMIEKLDIVDIEAIINNKDYYDFLFI